VPPPPPPVVSAGARAPEWLMREVEFAQDQLAAAVAPTPRPVCLASDLAKGRRGGGAEGPDHTLGGGIGG